MDIKDQKIILASSSPYRKELLKRLDIAFTTVSPEVNERYFQDELISDYVLRLAKTKAESIVSKNDNSLMFKYNTFSPFMTSILSIYYTFTVFYN